MIIAYHIIWTAYGHWLPNDPRGSGSKTIHNDILAKFGKLHYGRKKVQPVGRQVRDFYEQAAPLLRHPLLTFDETARKAIAAAFGQVIAKQKYTCYGCAVMPDHIHILIRKHRQRSEEMMEWLKDDSRNRLCTGGHAPPDHPIWSGGHGWIVFLDHPDEVRRTVGYIERNPLPFGLP